MEEAHRQTQRKLDIIDRQIKRRIMAHTPDALSPGTAPDRGAFLERYRSQLEALTAKHQPEVDALSRKLARQDHAVARFLDRHGEASGMSERA